MAKRKRTKEQTTIN